MHSGSMPGDDAGHVHYLASRTNGRYLHRAGIRVLGRLETLQGGVEPCHSSLDRTRRRCVRDHDRLLRILFLALRRR